MEVLLYASMYHDSNKEDDTVPIIACVTQSQALFGTLNEFLVIQYLPLSPGWKIYMHRE